jgi:5-bromo-4-chloroindolyl phosphate hydrolysis protein
MNKSVSKSENSREKLKKMLKNLKDNTTAKSFKIPKNFNLLLRKVYKYIKPNINLIDINFADLDEIDRDKQK